MLLKTNACLREGVLHSGKHCSVLHGRVDVEVGGSSSIGRPVYKRSFFTNTRNNIHSRMTLPTENLPLCHRCFECLIYMKLLALHNSMKCTIIILILKMEKQRIKE